MSAKAALKLKPSLGLIDAMEAFLAKGPVSAELKGSVVAI
jgi:hypothetical protein